MAFIPEDGTGLATANSYVTLAYGDTYFDDRGETAWSLAATGTQEAALIKATDYIESNYSWTAQSGIKIGSVQALSFPRFGGYDNDGYLIASDSVPSFIKKATCILALEILNGASINASVGRLTKREKAGAVEVEYMDGKADRSRYPEVDGLLAGIGVSTVGGSTSGRLIRG